MDEVLQKLQHLGVPHSLLVKETRSVLDARRRALLEGSNGAPASVEEQVEQRVSLLCRPSLRSVINATGVILHTNLGRAPLADFRPIPRYSNLEYNLATGRRGKRDAHTAGLLGALIGKPAIVVNNNAAAVYLVLNELAAGHEVIVSRGELIEIGDGFRIPEIMARSGAVLREVGTTNRTRIEDYLDAMNERTRLIMRVHQSNFRMAGFTARPELADLASLGREHGISVYEDLGSGCLVDLRSYGIDEPLVEESLKDGMNLVSFSCDKLLGGPQGGIIAGDADLIARIRRNPMYRAFRVDKLIIEALENTLRHLLLEQWSAIPTLRIIFTTPEEVRRRAERVAHRLEALDVVVRESESAIGGGSTPDQTLPAWVVQVNVADPVSFERALRTGTVPVIARVERDAVILDMRTVADDEEEALASAVSAAAGSV